MEPDSRIEMAQIKLLRCRFTVKSPLQPAGDHFAVTVSIKNNGEFELDGHQAHFTQHFKTGNEPDAPFSLEVEFGALFFLDPAPLPLEREHYVTQVFPRLVFPYVRDYVAETTRLGGFSPLMVDNDIFSEAEDKKSPAPLTTNRKSLH